MNLFEIYEVARDELFKYLNIENGYHIEFEFGQKFYDNNGCVHWEVDQYDDVDFEFTYAEDYTNRSESVDKEYTTFLIDDCCGEKYYLVFKTENYMEY